MNSVDLTLERHSLTPFGNVHCRPTFQRMICMKSEASRGKRCFLKQKVPGQDTDDSWRSRLLPVNSRSTHSLLTEKDA